jgi:putative Mg2+ transporter-C (MgtC) family protein
LDFGIQTFMFFQFQITFQLLLAVLLGGILGLEREYKRKEAGLRTYALVCLGSALFTILSFEIFREMKGNLGISFDPSRIIQAIAVGVGFLGAGIIILKEVHIEGLTTAAGLWLVAAIGVAVGAGFYFPAILATLLGVIILFSLRFLEEKFFRDKKLS